MRALDVVAQWLVAASGAQERALQRVGDAAIGHGQVRRPEGVSDHQAPEHPAFVEVAGTDVHVGCHLLERELIGDDADIGRVHRASTVAAAC